MGRVTDSQGDLFGIEESGIYANPDFLINVKKAGILYSEIDIGDITFRSGQEEPIHRWYRLTPSYSPGLVRYFLNEFTTSKKSVVFDPFSGRGTTGIECLISRIPFIGFEINPLLQEVGNRTLKIAKDGLSKHIDDYLSDCKTELNKFSNRSIDDVCLEFKIALPDIHDAYRWWKPEVLKNLLICKAIMKNQKYNSDNNIIWIALNKAVLDCANIHRNHPTITFDDNNTREINVYYEIKNNLNMITSDITRSGPISGFGFADIYCRDSTNIKLDDICNQLIDVVITSPPYPNRFSYVHQTRPQLHFMDTIETRAEATEIDLKTIGGTWGKATSNLQKEIIPVPHELNDVLDYYPSLLEKSRLMCNYATKYFIDMNNHIKSLSNSINRGNFRGAYVVGNSRLSGIEIYTEVILAKLFRKNGFHVEEIRAFRKRGGKKKLLETAILLRG